MATRKKSAPALIVSKEEASSFFGGPTVTVTGASTPKVETALSKALAGKNNKAAEKAMAADAGQAQAEHVTENTLDALRNLAQLVVDGEREVEEIAKKLKKAAESLAEIQEGRLPKLMQQHGLERFDFIDNTTGLKQTIKIEDKLRVSMPSTKVGQRFIVDVAACKPIYAWLREIGEAGSVKKTIDIPAGLIADERLIALMEHIKKFDESLEPGLAEKIEPATLTALVTRLREGGKNIHEALKVTPVLKAKVSAK